MNTTQSKIDQSVYYRTQYPGGKSSLNYIPLFPISTAEKLKLALVKKFSAQYANVAARLLYQAVNEAYALVSLTPEPLLLLPALAEEKVQSAAAWTTRQDALRRLDTMEFAA
jgi:hypothetical protein